MVFCWALTKRRNLIIILGLVAAFILGTLTANPIVEGKKGFIEEIIMSEARKTSLQNQLLLLDLPDFKTLVDAGDVGSDASIAIGDDGLPVISYFDTTFIVGGLKVAHCNDLACSPP